MQPSPHEHRETQGLPSCLTDVSTLNFALGTKEPTSIAEYEQKKLTPPQPKTYAINNNVLAVADQDGNMHAALHENSDKFRLEELEAATKKLDAMDYTQSNFYVPQFRRDEEVTWH